MTFVQKLVFFGFLISGIVVGTVGAWEFFWRNHDKYVDQRLTADLDVEMDFNNIVVIKAPMGQWQLVFYSDKSFQIEIDGQKVSAQKFERSDGENYRLTVTDGKFTVFPSDIRQIVHLRGQLDSKYGLLVLHADRQDANYGGWRPWAVAALGFILGAIVGLILGLIAAIVVD